MAHSLTLPTELGTAFTLADAQRHGISAMQLSRAGLGRPVYGIYLRPAPPHGGLHPLAKKRIEHTAIARALAPKLADHFCFTHETAALLWNLPVPVSDELPIRVASLNDRYRVKRRGVRCGVLTAELANVVSQQGVRLTSPAATWALLAPTLTRRDAIALGDAILHRPRIGGTGRYERDPLATVDELMAAIATPHRRHRVMLMRLAREITPCSASAPESHLRVFLTDMGWVPEMLDHDVRDGRGRFLGTSEIAYPSRKVVFEYEGDHHRTEARQWNRDIEKYAEYAAMGWVVVRVTADLLYRRPSVLRAQVVQIFERRPPVR